MSEQERNTLFELMGSRDRSPDCGGFYPKVLKNPLLAPLFPSDIEPVMDKQYMFLSQFLEVRLCIQMSMDTP